MSEVFAVLRPAYVGFYSSTSCLCGLYLSSVYQQLFVFTFPWCFIIFCVYRLVLLQRHSLCEFGDWESKEAASTMAEKILVKEGKIYWFKYFVCHLHIFHVAFVGSSLSGWEVGKTTTNLVMRYNGRNKKVSFSELGSYHIFEGMERAWCKRSQCLQQSFVKEVNMNVGWRRYERGMKD